MMNIANGKYIAGLVTGIVFMGWGLVAQATVITVGLDTEFSGADAPEGASTPWVTFTMDDGGTAGSVNFTIDSHGLVEEEFISAFYFNFDWSASISTFSYTTGQSAAEPSSFALCTTASTANSTSGCKADGDGYHDILLTWANSDFGANATFSFDLYGAGITADMFNIESYPGGGNGTWVAAADVQGIDQTLEDDNKGSGWIGGRTTPVPEPASIALMGLGLLGMGATARRRRSN